MKKQPGKLRKFFAPAKTGLISVAFALFMTTFSQPVQPVQAERNVPHPKLGGRTEERRVTVTTQHWQLANWASGALVCDLFLRHEDWPSYSDVRTSCGDAIMAEWLTTPACNGAASGNTADCEGLLLRYQGPQPVTYTETVQLPGIDVNLTPFTCPPGQWCDTRPALEVLAAEPLEGYQIERVHVRVGNQQKTFDGDTAVFNLPLTGEQGGWLEYWAESSYGDRSDRVRLRYRSRVSDDGANFHFDLLNTVHGRIPSQRHPALADIPAQRRLACHARTTRVSRTVIYDRFVSLFGGLPDPIRTSGRQQLLG